MITVALVGPDGAGKTTISERLVLELGVPVKRIYMGVNIEASDLLLPTTRLLARIVHGRAAHPAAGATAERGSQEPPGALRRAALSARAGARLTVWLSEEWARQLAAVYHAKLRKRIVVFDRHFYADYFDRRDARTRRDEPLTTRVHLFLLEHVYPKPDLVVFLDAPAEVLFARKPETPLDWLDRRREDYLALGSRVPRFARVDASRSTDEVAREVASLILSCSGGRGGTPRVDEGSQAR